MLSEPYISALKGQTDNVVVFIDEKEFASIRNNRKVWVLVNERPRGQRIKSKNDKERVMFSAAVAHPQPQHGFDGRIILDFWGYEDKYKYHSKYHIPGDKKIETITMKGIDFRRWVQYKLLPALKKKLSWANSITIILDNAKGHAVEVNVDDFNTWGSKCHPPIQFLRQPPSSPDMNLLDFAAWFSMDRVVQDVRVLGDNDGMPMKERIVDAVIKAWNEDWDCESALCACTVKLIQQYEEILKHGGNNDFQSHHLTMGKGRGRGSTVALAKKQLWISYKYPTINTL